MAIFMLSRRTTLVLQGLLGTSHHRNLPGESSPNVYGMAFTVIHAGLTAAVATCVATAALHDQPFRAMHGIAVISALHVISCMHELLCERHSCKRKPL